MDYLHQKLRNGQEFAEQLYALTDSGEELVRFNQHFPVSLEFTSSWGVKLNLPFSLAPYEDIKQLDQTMRVIDGAIREYYARPETLFTQPFCRNGGRKEVSLFNSAEGIRWMYNVCEGGALTLRPFDFLESGLADKLRAKGVSEKEYNPVRSLCIDFNTHLLAPFWQVGNLKDASVAEGDDGGPEFISFKDGDGSYLTPATILQFLNGDNWTKGPRELFFDYSADGSNESQVNHFFGAQYSPTKSRLKLIGSWKYEGKVMDRKVMVESLASLLSGKKISPL